MSQLHRRPDVTVVARKEPMPNDGDLLKAFAESGSQAAFDALVGKHSKWVYSMSVRLVGDRHLAEDVTQAVFLLLAQKARQLEGRGDLGGWLFKTCRYCAINAKEKQQIRNRHEGKAAVMKSDVKAQGEAGWDELAPMLDDGVAKLSKRDRDAVLMRYYEGRTHQEIASAIGISDEAAKKRVLRAVERLRDYFARHGVIAPAAATFGDLLAQNVAKLSPGTAMKIGATSTSAQAIAHSAGAIAMTLQVKVATAALVALVLGGAAAVAISKDHPAESNAGATTTPFVPATTQQVSPFDVIFAGGIEVEMVAVGRNPGPSAEWWLPDGTPLTAAPFDGILRYESHPPPILPKGAEKNMLIVLSRKRFPKSLGKYTWTDWVRPSATESGPLVGSTTRWKGKRIVDPPYAAVYYYADGIPQKVTVALGAAAGPWTLVASSNAPADGTLKSITVDSVIANTNVNLTINDSYDENFVHSWVYAIDKRGRRVEGATSMSGHVIGGPVHAQFMLSGIRPSQIDHYEMQTGPWQIASFDIATQPDLNRKPVDPGDAVHW